MSDAFGGGGNSASINLLSYLRYLDKITASDFATALKINTDLDGGTDNRFSLALLAPSKTGAQIAGTPRTPLVVASSGGVFQSYIAGSLSTLGSNTTLTTTSKSTLITLAYTPTNTTAELLLVTGGIEVNQAATLANIVTVRLEQSSLVLTSGTTALNTADDNGKCTLSILLKAVPANTYYLTVQMSSATSLVYQANKCFLEVEEFQ